MDIVEEIKTTAIALAIVGSFGIGLFVVAFGHQMVKY